MNILISMNIRKHNSIEDTIEHQYLDYFKKLGFYPILISNRMEIPQLFKMISIQCIVLTGGIDVCLNNQTTCGNLNKMRDSFELSLLHYGVQNRIPILGICRGMQLINVFFGGSIASELFGHVKINHQIIFNSKQNMIVPPIQKIIVNSYHNKGVFKSDLSKELNSLCQCVSDGLIEGVYHPSLPILAIQWHPERENNIIVDKLISNFIKTI